jgi:hypothetical protein
MEAISSDIHSKNLSAFEAAKTMSYVATTCTLAGTGLAIPSCPHFLSY